MSNLAVRDAADRSPPTKRRRVLKACDICRTRKEKCDGAQPSCSSCVEAGHVCSYGASAKRRGLAPGYVRLLETIMGMILEEVRNGEQTVRALLDHCIHQMDAEARSISQQTWRKSELQSELESALPGVEFLDERELNVRKSQKFTIDSTEPEDRNRVLNSGDLVWPRLGSGDIANDIARDDPPNLSDDPVHFDTESSAVPRTIITEQSMDPIGLTVNGLSRDDQSPLFGNLPSPPPGELFPNSQDEVQRALEADQQIYIPDSHTSHKVWGPSKLPANAWQLIEMYFTYTHCWFPIVDRASIMKSFSTYSQETSSTETTLTNEEAVLWAIIAYSTKQSMSGQVTIEPRSVQSYALDAYKIARRIVFQEHALFDLARVQALLLLSLIELGDGHMGAAWTTVGHAARVILEMIDYSNPPADPLHKQVMLGCFMLDTLISAHLEHSPQLQTHDFDKIGTLEEGGLEEWDFWRPMTGHAPPLDRSVAVSHQAARTRSTFNQLCKLMAILNNAVTWQSNGPSLASLETSLDQLRSWRNQLPAFFGMDEHHIRGSVPSFTHVVHVHMCTCMVAIMIHLRMAKLSQSKSDRSLNLDPLYRRLTWLIDENIRTSGASTVPATVTLFTKLLSRVCGKEDPNLISASTQTEVNRILDRTVIAAGAVWHGISKSQKSAHDASHLNPGNLLRAPSTDAQYFPQMPSSVMDITTISEAESEINILGSGTSHEAVGSILPQAMATPEAMTAGTSLDMFGLEPPIDEATFQSMLLTYGSERDEEQADFWRNLGFLD